MGLDKNNRPNGWDTKPWGTAIEVTQADYDFASVNTECYWNGTELVNPIPPAPRVPTVEEIKNNLMHIVQQHLDSGAINRGYDSILSACSYDNDTNPIFAAEATAYKIWRSAVWTYCYQEFARVQNGLRTIPSAEELIIELPALVF